MSVGRNARAEGCVAAGIVMVALAALLLVGGSMEAAGLPHNEGTVMASTLWIPCACLGGVGVVLLTLAGMFLKGYDARTKETTDA